MNPYNLQESNWSEIRKEEFDIAILPWGATEAHNFHLPYGTDTILAEDVAIKAAEKAWEHGAKCIVLPPIAYGVNSGQIDIKLCMHINPSTQLSILGDILFVLDQHDIDKLVILNAHGGNNFQPIIRELSLEYPDIIMCNVDWWRALDAKNYFEEPGDHAGELETSCMQAIRADIVLPLEMAGGGEEHKMKIKAFQQKWAWTPRRWVYTSDDTGVGNPYAASAEKGEAFLYDSIEEISRFLVELADVGSERELYVKSNHKR